MIVVAVLTASTFVLPRVFALHAARLVYEHLNLSPGEVKLTKSDVLETLEKRDSFPNMRIAYRWGLSAALIKMLRWPLVILLLILILV